VKSSINKQLYDLHINTFHFEIYINSVSTAQKTYTFSIKKNKLLVMFKDIFSVYSENYTNVIKCVDKIQSFFFKY
jgi:hypothetical protein